MGDFIIYFGSASKSFGHQFSRKENPAQPDSPNGITDEGCQAADAVAWAFFQKYERGDPRFYNVIASKVIVE